MRIFNRDLIRKVIKMLDRLIDRHFSNCRMNKNG